MTITRERLDIMNVSPAMEQIYFRFADGVEVTIPYKITPAISAGLNILQTAPDTQNITVDLTDPMKLISFG
jgi:hypothetical protein